MNLRLKLQNVSLFNFLRPQELGYFCNSMRKKKVLEDLEITEVVAEGKTMARVDDRVVFIKGGAPGDVVDVRVTNRRKSFYEGVILDYKKYSDLRIESFCSHFETCGGCKWQHLPYDFQLSFKQKQVIDNFERLGKFPIPAVTPILGSEDTTYYRNKLEYTFSDSRWLTKEEIDSEKSFERNALGFHIPGRFDKILDIDHCYLQPEPSNEIRNWIRAYALENGLTFFNLRDQHGLLRNLVIRTTSTNQVMVILQLGEDKPQEFKPLLDALAAKFNITSLNYVVNLKKNDTYADQEVINYAGQPYIEESMQRPDDETKLTFRIGPKSFYQTNSKQAGRLYKRVYELADIKPDEVVYDLYTGTGTIANYLANCAKLVIGLEYIPEAIEDAQTNSAINKIDNALFFAGDMKDILTRDFVAKNGKPDVIITDPPRAGMHQDVIDTILNSSPNRIVYVSCNPATQARDISLMSEMYSVEAFQPVDMFPHTHHVENIALLKRKENAE